MRGVAQGILFTTGDTIKQPSELVRLWMHEAYRVYSDKFIDAVDNDTFTKLINETVKKNCEVSSAAKTFQTSSFGV